VFGRLRSRLGIVAGTAATMAAEAVRSALTPSPQSGPVRGLVVDLARSRKELLAENALLRHQLVIAARSIKHPKLRAVDRLVLVGLAAVVADWRNALLIVQPETLLRWHRDLFRRFWARRSKPKAPPQRRLGSEVIALIKRMALENRTWGAKRIRGELLKLGIDVAKSTIQRYLSRFRSTPTGQRWSTFLRNQAESIWCCDLLEFRDLCFRCHFVFVVMHLESRRLLCAVTTREPTSDWLAQQLRELTPFGTGPKYLLRDNDAKFGNAFDAVAESAGIQIVRTPVLAPKANCHVERLIGTLRRECLDHVLVLHEGHLQRVLDEYRGFFNDARPHQGIGQRQPSTSDHPALAPYSLPDPDKLVVRPVLGGLHHDYQLAP
jgi:transposase InsO family protein